MHRVFNGDKSLAGVVGAPLDWLVCALWRLYAVSWLLFSGLIANGIWLGGAVGGFWSTARALSEEFARPRFVPAVLGQSSGPAVAGWRILLHRIVDRTRKEKSQRPLTTLPRSSSDASSPSDHHRPATATASHRGAH